MTHQGQSKRKKEILRSESVELILQLDRNLSSCESSTISLITPKTGYISLKMNFFKKIDKLIKESSYTCFYILKKEILSPIDDIHAGCEFQGPSQSIRPSS